MSPRLKITWTCDERDEDEEGDPHEQVVDLVDHEEGVDRLELRLLGHPEQENVDAARLRQAKDGYNWDIYGLPPAVWISLGAKPTSLMRKCSENSPETALTLTQDSLRLLGLAQEQRQPIRSGNVFLILLIVKLCVL